MAEEEQLQQTNEEENTSGSEGNPWVKRIVVVFGILLVIGVEIGVSYVVNKRVVIPSYFAQDTIQVEEPEQEESMETAPYELNPNIYMLENLVINPTGTNGSRYVAMAIGLGVEQQETLEVLKTRDIQVRDAINTLLGNKGLREFVDVNYRSKLKQEILDTVNAKIQPAEVESIYFTEYVIQ